MNRDLFRSFVEKQKDNFKITVTSGYNAFNARCREGVNLDIKTWSGLIKDFVSYIVEEYLTTKYSTFKYITPKLFDGLDLKELNIYTSDGYRYIAFYTYNDFRRFGDIDNISSLSKRIVPEIYYSLCDYSLYINLRGRDNLGFTENDIYRALRSELANRVYSVEQSKCLGFREIMEKSHCNVDRFLNIVNLIGDYGDYDLVDGVITKVPTGCRVGDIDSIINVIRYRGSGDIKTQSYVSLPNKDGHEDNDTCIYFDLVVDDFSSGIYVNIFNRVEGTHLIVNRNTERLKQLSVYNVEYIVIYADKSTATSWHLGEGITKTYPTLLGSKCFSSQLSSDIRFNL